MPNRLNRQETQTQTMQTGAFHCKDLDCSRNAHKVPYLGFSQSCQCQQWPLGIRVSSQMVHAEALRLACKDLQKVYKAKFTDGPCGGAASCVQGPARLQSLIANSVHEKALQSRSSVTARTCRGKVRATYLDLQRLHATHVTMCDNNAIMWWGVCGKRACLQTLLLMALRNLQGTLCRASRELHKKAHILAENAWIRARPKFVNTKT